MTTQVDFYVLAAALKPDLFICRLSEKAYLQNKKIHVHAASEQHAQLLDTMLWTFRDDSFVPHDIFGAEPKAIPPIQIGHLADKANHQEVLINLHPEIPEIAWQSQRIIEIVTDNTKAKSREHYKAYRQQGYTIKSHAIN